MNQKLPIAVTALNGRVQPSQHLQAQGLATLTQPLLDLFKKGGVLDDTALAHLPGLQLELRLDQQDGVAPDLEQGHHGRQHQRQRNEGHISDQQVKGLVPRLIHSASGTVMLGPEGLRAETAGVDALDADHPLIGTQLRMQLPLSHINAHHPSRAVLQQAVGKATGRLAQIQAHQTSDIEFTGGQGPLELETATGEVTRLLGVTELELSALGHFIAILGNRLPGLVTLAPKHARGDQALRLRTGRGMPAFDKKEIGTHVFGSSH